MEHLQVFISRLPSEDQVVFKSFLEDWELNRTYYLFLGPKGAELDVYSLENMKIVHSVDASDIANKVAIDTDFLELASQKRYGSIEDVSLLSKDQVKGLIRHMSEQSEIAFFNVDFESINSEVEVLLQ